jgi:hypothetical protein
MVNPLLTCFAFIPQTLYMLIATPPSKQDQSVDDYLYPILQKHWHLGQPTHLTGKNWWAHCTIYVVPKNLLTGAVFTTFHFLPNLRMGPIS